MNPSLARRAKDHATKPHCRLAAVRRTAVLRTAAKRFCPELLRGELTAPWGGIDALQAQGRYLLRFQIDNSNPVGVRVGDVELAVRMTETARLAEQRARQPAVRLA